MPSGSGAAARRLRTIGEPVRIVPRRAAPAAARTAATTAPAMITTASAAAPRPSTSQSACAPTSGSRRRAKPTGKRVENAIAPPTATTTAVTAVTTIGRAMPRTSAARVKPIARNADASSAMACTDRVRAWPTMTIPARTTAAAKRSSPVRSSPVLWVMRLRSSPRSRTGMSGSFIAAATRSWNLVTSVPGRKRTTRFWAPGTCGGPARKAGVGVKPGSTPLRKIWSIIESPTPTMRARTVGPPVIGDWP